MKIVVIVLLLAIGIAVYFTTASKAPVETAPDGPVDIRSGAVWESPVPDGARVVEEATPEYEVTVTRVGPDTKPKLEFRVTEKSGYMADGIMVRFWYRYQDASGEWVDDSKKIGYQCRGRLGFDDELVETALPLPHELAHIEGLELGSTTSENWAAEVSGQMRVMEPAD